MAKSSNDRSSRVVARVRTHDDPNSRHPEAYDWFGLAEQLCEINNGFYDEDIALEPQDLIDFLKDWPVAELETHMYDPTGKVILLGRIIQYRDEKIAYEFKKENESS